MGTLKHIEKPGASNFCAYRHDLCLTFPLAAVFCPHTNGATQMAYTLAQFEQIDGLLTAFQNRGDLKFTAMPRNAIRSWMLHEWMLEDACVDVLGLEHTKSFPCAEACAADFVTRCLCSASLVEA
jgi:hypothetical protein